MQHKKNHASHSLLSLGIRGMGEVSQATEWRLIKVNGDSEQGRERQHHAKSRKEGTNWHGQRDEMFQEGPTCRAMSCKGAGPSQLTFCGPSVARYTSAPRTTAVPALLCISTCTRLSYCFSRHSKYCRVCCCCSWLPASRYATPHCIDSERGEERPGKTRQSQPGSSTCRATRGMEDSWVGSLLLQLVMSCAAGRRLSTRPVRLLLHWLWCSQGCSCCCCHAAATGSACGVADEAPNESPDQTRPHFESQHG